LKASLLLIQPLDTFGVLLQGGPGGVERAGQIRTNGQRYWQRRVSRSPLPQRIPRKPQFAQALHVGPGLQGVERLSLDIGRADGEDPFLSPQTLDPDAVAAQVAVAG